MAKQRMIETSIWRKSRKFRACDPLVRYLYLYLISNEDLDLCGAYEQDLDDMAHYTGIDRRTLPQMFQKLEEQQLAMYRDGWVIVLRYRAKDSNLKVRIGIENSMAALPEEIREIVLAGKEDAHSTDDGDTSSKPMDGLSEAMDSQSIPISDFDFDSDSDIDSDEKSTAAVAAAPATRELSAMKDPLADRYQRRMTAVFPAEAWGNVGQERGQLAVLARKTRALLQRTPFEDDVGLADAILAQYLAMIRTEKGEFWRNAPFTPSGLSARWDKVVAAMAAEVEHRQAWRSA